MAGAGAARRGYDEDGIYFDRDDFRTFRVGTWSGGLSPMVVRQGLRNHVLRRVILAVHLGHREHAHRCVFA
jgi:hypothetical protein